MAKKNPVKKIVKPKKAVLPVQDRQQHDYFVALHHPRELRRTLLESSRSLIYSMQRYQKINLIRDEKKKLLVQFRSKIKEIVFLFNKLQESLPKHKLPEMQQIPKKQPLKQETPKQVQQPATKDELDKLSVILANIEDKLNKL